MVIPLRLTKGAYAVYQQLVDDTDLEEIKHAMYMAFGTDPFIAWKKTRIIEYQKEVLVSNCGFLQLRNAVATLLCTGSTKVTLDKSSILVQLTYTHFFLFVY